jgi:hypothetical protein
MNIQRDAITLPVASQGKPSGCRGHMLVTSAPYGGLVRDEAGSGSSCTDGNLVRQLAGKEQANVLPCGGEGGHVLICRTKPAPSKLASVAIFRIGEKGVHLRT